MKLLLLWTLVGVSISCYSQKIDVQGHRGAAGVLPENTVPAFLFALGQGVTSLDLDVVISKDSRVVVSHDLWISPEICLDGNNTSFRENSDFNIYQMTYEEVREFNCGFLNRAEAKNIKPLSKPLLNEVIAEVERHIKDKMGYEVDYHIEIRSYPDGDNRLHPPVEQFSNMVYQTIDQYLPMSRVIIQSKDLRVLKYWHKNYPRVRLSLIVDNKKTIDTNLANLGFKPDIYSPDYSSLTREKVRNIKRRGIKVVPWVVNKPEDMRQVVEWGVDGFITDFPDRARKLRLTLPMKHEEKL